MFVCLKSYHFPADTAGSSLCLGQNLLVEMNHQFRNIESNLLLAFPCILDSRFKKVAFSDAAALDACIRCLMDEMKTVAAVADNICIEIEEGTSTSTELEIRIRNCSAIN